MRLDEYGTDTGTVSIGVESTEIIAGRKYRMTVIYTAGPQGIAAGGCVRFRLPRSGRRVLRSSECRACPAWC